LDWLEFTLLVPAADAEAVAEVLRRHCPGGVSIEEPILPASGDEGYALDPGRPAAVHAYLPRDGDLVRRRRALRRELTALGLAPALHTRWRREEEWAEAWKRFFDVERVGQRLVVCPTWIEYSPREGEVLLRLDPGMAFGTGQHPTTRLCLEALESQLRPGHQVLDLGTGSGILAIAAALLGAARAVALDVDPVAVGVARQNVAANGLEGRVQVLERGLSAVVPRMPDKRRSRGFLASAGCSGGARKPRLRARSARSVPFPDTDAPCFDMVLANISSAAITEMAPDLARALAPGGTLIVSGISEASAGACRHALEKTGLRVIEQAQRDGWCALTCSLP
jgi:ribosomal protein L11 methyltransferase